MDSIDKQLDEMLRRREISIGNDGFSENVLRRLPERKFNRGKSRRWTLAGAAAMGSILTLILAPPIETAFRLFEILSAYQIWMFVVFLIITVLAIPLAWFLYSRLVENSWNPGSNW